MAVALVLLVGGAAVVSGAGAGNGAAVSVARASAEQEAEIRVTGRTRRERGGTDALQDPEHTVAPSSDARPVRVVIPSIDVDSSLERLHRDGRGVLEAPLVADTAGWWTEGPVPGQVGAAVLVGHLNTIQGAAVFVDLRRLRPGDAVEVRLSDGTTSRFTVDGSRVVDKALFPSDEVYAAVPDPQLRLITCSEPFDPVAGTYTDNLVVFASARRA